MEHKMPMHPNLRESDGETDKLLFEVLGDAVTPVTAAFLNESLAEAEGIYRRLGSL